MLREKVALEVHKWHCPEEDGIDEVYWTGPSMQDYLDCADQILPLIREEIEKVGNPYGTTKWTTVDEIKAFEECRHRILAFIKEA